MTDKGLAFYVSPDGDDGWSGRAARHTGADGPFATVQKAVEASRLEGAGLPRTIVVGGGSYYGVSVSLCPEDSGLTIEAAEGETPVLCGGRRIEGWKREEQGGFWYAEPPEVASGEWDFRLLTVNGRLCGRARLPESGEFLHETEFNVEWLSTTAGGWARKPTAEELSSLRYKEGDLGPWLDIRNAELTVYHKWDESAVAIASHDEKSRRLKFAHPCGHPPGAFRCRKYCVWNTREGMKRPGQWYLNRTAGRVVYWPLPGEDMNSALAAVPTADNIFRFSGRVADVTLKGLRLEAAGAPLMAADFGAYMMPGAIEAPDGLERCRFEGLSIRNTGGHGMKISGRCHDVAILNCDIENTGAGGILLFSAARAGNVIENNRVRHVGTLCTSAIAVSAHCCDVIGNEISDAPYSGIAYSASKESRHSDAGARIEGNTVSRVMRFLNDGGAIYVTFTQNGVVRGNVVRDIQQGDEPDTGRNGIYLDEQTEGWVVEGNLVVDCTHPTLNHMARRNVFRNNVFASGSWLKVNAIRCREYVFERNVVSARGKLIFSGNPDAITGFSNNLLWSQSGEYEQHCIGQDYKLNNTLPLDLRNGTVATDPMFTDEEGGDYSLKPGSPAFALGIEPIPSPQPPPIMGKGKFRGYSRRQEGLKGEEQ